MLPIFFGSSSIDIKASRFIIVFGSNYVNSFSFGDIKNSKISERESVNRLGIVGNV